MKRLIKRCCPFLLGITLVSSLWTGNVQAASNTGKKLTPSGITISDMEKQIDEYVEKYIGKSIPGAVVVVAKDNEVLLDKAYGTSNTATKTGVTTKDTTFELGTLTKLYTYTAVMQQVEQGKMSLQEDIFTYLPQDFASKLKKHLSFDQTITVMNLINNTAGFEETGLDIAVSDIEYLSGSLKEALEKTMPDQVYQPGEVMTGASYSSALLGYLVETVTGMEFSEYAKQYLFEPIGAESSVLMADTTKEAKVNKAKAVPYGVAAEGEFREVSYMYSNLYPNSGAVTSGEDLSKFLLSYLPKDGADGPLLKQETIRSMWEKTYSINENAKGQCIGFYEYPSDGVNAYYHDGTSNGYSSMMTIVPEEGFGVAIMANCAVSNEFMYGLTNLLVVGEEEELVYCPTGNPNLADFTGISFVGAKRAIDSVMEFVGYFGNCSTFKKSENNALILDSKEYTQVAPYVFQYVESSDKDKNTVIQKTIAKYIYFGHDETGKVTKWSYGGSGTVEFVATDNSSMQSYLTLGIFAVIVGALLCAVLFSTSLILTALDLVHKKKLFHSPKCAFRLSVIVFVGLEYNMIKELVTLMGNNLVASKQIFWNTIANYGFTAAILLSFGYFVYCYRNETIKPGRALFYGTVYAFIGVYIGLMFVWKFFAIM